MIEMDPLISKNQFKKSMSCVMSPHLMRLGKGTSQKMLDIALFDMEGHGSVFSSLSLFPSVTLLSYFSCVSSDRSVESSGSTSSSTGWGSITNSIDYQPCATCLKAFMARLRPKLECSSLNSNWQTHRKGCALSSRSKQPGQTKRGG